MRFTPEGPFCQHILASAEIMTVVSETSTVGERVHEIMGNELAQEEIKEASRQVVISIASHLIVQRVQNLICGCIKLTLLFKSRIQPIPMFDTAEIAALAALATENTKTLVSQTEEA